MFLGKALETKGKQDLEHFEVVYMTGVKTSDDAETTAVVARKCNFWFIHLFL